VLSTSSCMLISSSLSLSLSLCCGCSLMATTALSLRPAHPVPFPYKLTVSPVVLISFLFHTMGHNCSSGRCSHRSGFSDAIAASRFFFRFGGADPSTTSSFSFYATR
jgi:hypothetical protein